MGALELAVTCPGQDEGGRCVYDVRGGPDVVAGEAACLLKGRLLSVLGASVDPASHTERDPIDMSGADEKNEKIEGQQSTASVELGGSGMWKVRGAWDPRLSSLGVVGLHPADPASLGPSYVPRPSVWLWALKWEPWVQMGFKPNRIASTHLSQPRQWTRSPCRWGQE